MKRLTIETAVGLFVLLGIACLAWLSVRLGKLEIVGGDYAPVHAEFASASGLKTGASVEIAGVEVGKVDAIRLEDYRADVRMKIRTGIRLQEDVDRPGLVQRPRGEHGGGRQRRWLQRHYRWGADVGRRHSGQ